MTTHADRVAIATASIGTGTLALGSPIDASFFTMAEAGITNGLSGIPYLLEEGLDVELGFGTYSTSGPSFSRDTVVASRIAGVAGTTKLTLTGTATVRLTLLAQTANSFPAGPTPTVTADNPVVWDGTTARLLKQVTYSTFKANLSLTKTDVGLSNVDNTSDASKPVSTAQQTALDAKLDDSQLGVTVQAYDADTLKGDVEDQGPLTGGARITPKDLGNLSGATITPDPGDRGIQKITNNGAGTIAPGSNYGAYLLQIINTTGAAAITVSGWTLVNGDAFTTPTTAKFLCHCTVTADFSLMNVVKVVA